MDTINKALTETEVDLKLITVDGGQLMSTNIPEPLRISLGSQFPGEKKEWTPGQLFLSAISSSFVATLQSLTRYSNTKDLYCCIISHGRPSGTQYELERLTLSLSMNADSVETMMELQDAIEMAKQQCFVLKLLNCEIDYHSEIRHIPKG